MVELVIEFGIALVFANVLIEQLGAPIPAAPILIVASGNDAFICTSAIEDFASRLKNCARIVIAGARHEILQERDQFREQFWAAFDAFVPGSVFVARRSEQAKVVR